MNRMADILFEYLQSIFYNASSAELDLSCLDEDFKMLGQGLAYFAQCFGEYNALAAALAKGDLDAKFPPPENELAAPLKSLYASLKHLTWQTQQVAKGDYTQRVDFMGEFSNSFNSMIIQLDERQRQLEKEIETIQQKTAALESGNQLLTNITEHIPQQIIVAEKDTHELLFANESAKREARKEDNNLQKLLEIIVSHTTPGNVENEEIQFDQGGVTHYLSVISYELEWNGINAVAYVVQDISIEKNHIIELEDFAYRDTMTHLFNRFAGMMTLNKWMDQKKQFALVFVDLDSLKRVNDLFGHNEGDRYIISAATRLLEIVPGVVACRVGGDEFMVLIPDVGYDEAQSLMTFAHERLSGDEYLKGKDFEYHFSFGIVDVGMDNELTSSEILSIADERMYENKQAMKKQRKEQAYR
jgi:diguanylate cyclase (GGDEF)-like protein